MNYSATFDECWVKFINRLKGMITSQRDKQNFTYPVLRLTLTDAATVWENRYDECGMWLINYGKENPQKAAQIKDILLRDMRFTEIPVKKDATKSAAVIASVAAAAVGLGISSAYHASNLVTFAATALPALATYPAVTATGNIARTKKEDENLSAYLAQLDKFRLSIVNIIDN